MESDKDIDILQGQWRQIYLEVDGARKRCDEYGEAPIVSFCGNKFSVHGEDGAPVLEGSFTLDPHRHPKAIDWTDTFGKDAGKTFPAIYSIRGDEFTFCAGEEGNRPLEFRTRIGDTMRKFRRISYPCAMVKQD